MPDKIPEHTPRVRKLLSQLDADRETLLGYYESGHAQTGGNLYAMDMFVMGIVKRTLGLTSAMQMLIQTWNLVTARTLLRPHIDSALRLSAIWLVDDINDVVKRIMNGERLDKIKDRNGQPMRDAYLITKLVDDHEWLKEVYENLSGYIHFSKEHINSPLIRIGEDGKFDTSLSSYDLHYPESSWIEVLECFRAVTAMISFRMAGYSETKKMTPAQIETGRKEIFGK